MQRLRFLGKPPVTSDTRRAWTWGVLSVFVAILFGGDFVAAAPDERVVAGFTFIDVPDDPYTPEKPKGYVVKNSIYRELARQLVVLTAREEFGMATRDAVLLEPVDQASVEFGIKVEARAKQAFMFDVLHEGKTLYQTRIKSALPAHEEVMGLARKLDAEVPAALVAALEKAGFQRKPNKTISIEDTGSGAVPEEVEEHLLTMNHLAQVRALRSLHKLIREDGESPQRLSALCRGYANLTQFTLPAMDSRGSVFCARALMYARRLERLAPDSPLSLWTDAYVGTLIGYPTHSLDAIKKVDKLLEEDPVAPPAWMALIDDYANYRFKDLSEIALEENNPLQELAALLWFRCSMHSQSSSLLIETGSRVFEVIPQCQCVVDYLSIWAGVGFGHKITRYAPRSQADQLTDYLPTWEGLPEEVLGLSQVIPAEMNMIRRGELSAALVAAAKEDREEPSLAVLGRNIEAWNIVQGVRRACFLRHSLSVSASDEIEAMEPVIADHPIAPVIRMLGVRRGAKAAEFIKVIGKHEFTASNWYLLRQVLYYMPKDAKFANMTVGDATYKAHTGSLKNEIYYLNSYQYRDPSSGYRNAKWFGPVSRNAPMRYAAFMWNRWDKHRGEVDDWLAKYGQHPIIKLAAAEGLIKEGDLPRGIDLLEGYLRDAPDPKVFRTLADIYFQSDNDDWLSTMERVMDHPDYGLSHSTAARSIAATLMSQGKFEEAKPWAQRASQSGSGDGFSCLTDCLTALGEFDDAEQLARQNSMRYGGDQWYDWCVQNDRGDLQKAWAFKRERMKKTNATEYDKEFAAGLHLVNSGKFKQARKLLAKQLEERFQPWDAVLLAVLYDEADLNEQRDQVFKTAVKFRNKSGGHPVLCASVPMFQELIAKGSVNRELRHEFHDKVTAAAGLRSSNKLALEYDALLALMSETRGKREDAIEQWRVCARVSQGGWFRNLAWSRLRKLGEDPVDLEGRKFAGQFTKKAAKPETE